MDILIHTFSGVAAGTVAASYSTKGFKSRLAIILFGGLGGAFPDLDAISMYSKFDSSIGRFLNLSHKGNDIYFSKLWYSHHAVLHSIIGCLLIVTIISLANYLVQSKFKEVSFRAFLQNVYAKRTLFLAFISGFIIHLLEDMPTPSCVWGGVNLFFPSSAYVGGTGDIWWWNNYDIFLIVSAVIFTNFLLTASNSLLKLNLKKITSTVFILGFCLAFYQIKTRGFDFNYTGFNVNYVEYETKSKEIQKRILGDKIYDFMVDLDNKIPLNF